MRHRIRQTGLSAAVEGQFPLPWLVFETAVRKDERLYLAPARCMRFVLVADLPHGALSAREVVNAPSDDSSVRLSIEEVAR